ncbi:MAG: sigma 54-interacting transcriptional regulator [Polyangiales bacterium]
MIRDDRTATAAPSSRASSPPGGPLQLVEVSAHRVACHALPARGTVTLGRAADAGVPLDDAQASRLHATLTVGDAVTLTDAGSRNGTRVRDTRLAAGETIALALGDAIDIGGTTLVLQSAAAPARPPTPAAPGMRARVVLDDGAVRQVAKVVERVAPGVISVLLLGETGVGKEVFAEMVHRCSRRAARPFLRLNCAALSESLLESELFGHERGAFTGAAQAKPGLLESAHGGTVFLDEVGELPAAVQVKLLRVIEERRVTRVGALQPRELDVRFVAATHRDLEAEIDAGRFRQDLYFRLNGISLRIPPLRDRGAEVEALARVFLGEACARSGIAAAPALSAEAVAALRAHPWPGNLRELRNVMERAALLCDGGVITPDALALDARASRPPGEPRRSDPDGPLKAEIADIERRRILDALERCRGNQTRAAELLGISRRTLITRLDEYGVERPRK